MKNFIKFGENYNLITQKVNNNVIVEVAKSINHILVIDVSGSMSYDLSLIRTQLKNKLSNLIKGEKDTISIIWFSGNNEAGILKEEVEIKSLKTLSDLNDAIDRWLKPIGLTAFHKPLLLVKEVINRIKKNRPDSENSLLFLTDGYCNNCSWKDVITALKDIGNDLASSTFIEYGYYCNSESISEMASIVGGNKISASSFDEYDVVFEKKLTSSVNGGKKTLIEITDKYLYDFAFSVDSGDILLYNIVDGKIMVNPNIKEVHFFSANEIGNIKGKTTVEDDSALYGAIYILADKLLNEDAERVFYALGDNHYYQMLANAFGKQKLNAFKTAIKECISDVAKRFIDGKGNIQKIDDNAYCFMNLIADLGNMDGVLFYPNHEEFNYNRIGRKRVARGSDLSDADKKRLTEASNVEEAAKIIEELKEKNVDIKFVNSNPDRGYYLTDLVWNEERANLSIRIFIDGEVILPKNNKYGLDKIASFKYNTFTIVKDGILNVSKLPVNYSPELEKLLKDKGVKYEIDNSTFDNKIIIDLSSIPVINRGMVKSISANDLAKQEWKLLKLQADKKVYDYYRKSLFPKTSKSFLELGLTEDCVNWLKEIGITDFNGFAPKTDAAESTDFYMSVNLATKVKGLSSLPKVEDVVTKIKDGKTLKLNEWIMADAIKKYLAQLESDMYKTLSEEQQKGVLKTYLETKSTILNKQRREALQEIAQIKFALILSKKWFKEFKTFDENKLSVKFDGQDLEFTFDLSEKEVKI